LKNGESKYPMVFAFFLRYFQHQPVANETAAQQKRGFAPAGQPRCHLLFVHKTTR
jgi:hypothetical protein